MIRLLWCVLLLVLGSSGAAAKANPDSPPDATSIADLERIARLELRDQHGQVDSILGRRGAPVVAVVVSVRRLAMIEKWERDLSIRVPGVSFFNVADLPADAPVDLERTAETLRKRVPAGVNVLLDPGREWAAAFGLDTGLPNLLLFDAAGQLRARFRGRWTDSLATEVAAAIRQMEAAP